MMFRQLPVRTHSRTLSACSNTGFQLNNTFSHPLITSPVLLQYKRVGNALDKTPEQFAQEHNLMLNNSATAENGGENVSITITNTAQFCRQPIHVALFSVDLGGCSLHAHKQKQRTGKMRSLRLFYSDPPACTSGQLVIASHESQYKILHFHHGGLDKLALVFEQWQAVTGKTNRVCRVHVSKSNSMYARIRPTPMSSIVSSLCAKRTCNNVNWTLKTDYSNLFEHCALAHMATVRL
jgi:hypothetical protein